MNNILKMTFTAAIAALSVTFSTASPAVAEEPAHQIAIIADLNAENPILTNERYRQRITDMLVSEVEDVGLRYGDKVILRTAGDASLLSQLDSTWNREIQFAYRQVEPGDLPQALRSFMAKLADIAPQDRSELVWAVGQLAGSIDCAANEVVIFVLSNGLEAGQVIDGKFRMPTFAGQPFADCGAARVVFLGFGAKVTTGNPNLVPTAETLVGRVFTSAGFGSVEFKR